MIPADHYQRFTQALVSAEPTAALNDMALTLRDAGTRQMALYDPTLLELPPWGSPTALIRSIGRLRQGTMDLRDIEVGAETQIISQAMFDASAVCFWDGFHFGSACRLRLRRHGVPPLLASPKLWHRHWRGKG